MTTNNNAGRVPKYQEKLTERVVVYLTPTQLEGLRARAPGGDVSSFSRQCLQTGPHGATDQTPDPLEGDLETSAMAGTNQFRGPLLGPVPCGPWREACEDSSTFVLSRETAEFLEVREGDLFLPAQGHSMEGSGILDGYLVIVRPLDGKIPRRHEIVLVGITTEDGTTSYTLKHWGGFPVPGGPPQLFQADGSLLPLPEGTTDLQPLGRAVAVLGRL